MCLGLGTIPYSNFQCLTRCRRTAPDVQTGRHYPCIQVRRSETASNYRPISLFSIVSKLLEKIVSTQLKAFLASNSLLNFSESPPMKIMINEILIPRQKTVETGQKQKNSFLTDDLVSLFSHDVSRQLCGPSSDGQSRRKKETDQVR